MSSKVFYASTRASKKNQSMIEKLYKLFKRAGFDNLIEEDELIGIKQHFGEIGNTAFIRPIYTRRIVEAIKEAGGKPFLTDANTLYVGERANSVDHLHTAHRNGFGYSTVGAPIIIADGINGKSYLEIEVGLKHFDYVKIGSEICNADGMISLAHFKGHGLTGFGGTFKNIGMGLGSRSGKQMMHSTVKPSITEEHCIKCKECMLYCPEDAIEINDDASFIIEEKCIGCGECVVTCPTEAISIEWESGSMEVQERQVEFTAGVLKTIDNKAGYVNFVNNVTPDCDCSPWSDQPLIRDQGILASKDPVALEQASLDLTIEAEALSGTAIPAEAGNAEGENKFKLIHNSTDGGLRQIEYAEELGLGTRDYKLIKI